MGLRRTITTKAKELGMFHSTFFNSFDLLEAEHTNLITVKLVSFNKHKDRIKNHVMISSTS